jgi:hypothetical protein
MEPAQQMKRALTDFFPPCRKWLIVALITMNLSGCAVLDRVSPDAAIFWGIVTAPIWMPPFVVYDVTFVAIGRAIGPSEQAIAEKTARIKSNALPIQESLVQKARAYLKTACEQDERLIIKPGITLGEDNKILILRRGDAPLPLLNKILSLHRENALLPLLKTAPKETAPDALIKYRSSSHDEFRFQSTRRFREIQYGYGIPWDDDSMLYAAWYAFPASAVPEQQFFIKTEQRFIETGGKYFQLASKAYFERAGLGEWVIKDLKDKYAKSKFAMSPATYETASERRPFELPIDAPPSTKYALSIEDISTLEDRAHWVARGRLALIERESGEAVAEYVGFAANLEPGMQGESSIRRWDDPTELCPNAAEKPRMIVRSFLQKILDAKQP